jgi:hypothetical protein
LIFDQPTFKMSYAGAPWYQPSSQRVTATGHFENTSTNNHWQSMRRKGLAIRDVGSNWTAFESGIEASTFEFDDICRLSGSIYHAYKGPVLAGIGSSNMTANDFFSLLSGDTDEVNLAGKGTSAIAKCIPTNPISDLPVAVGELLTEGLPRIPGRALNPKNFSVNFIPGEYLGFEFGIKPFLAALGEFRIAVTEAERLIAQYARDSGKPIRRRFEFPAENTSNSTLYPATTGFEKYLGGPCQSEIQGYLQTVLGGWPGELEVVDIHEKKTWFSGCFTYYLPPIGDKWSEKLLRQEAELRYLYGGLSVETAWNLLPYSWAADWFTNAGDLIHNLQQFAQDGLVMPWGYVMESNKLRSIRTVRGAKVGRVEILNGSFTSDGGIVHNLPDLRSTYTVKYLRRRKATPFGFGLTDDDLTNRQKAITAALLF